MLLTAAVAKRAAAPSIVLLSKSDKLPAAASGKVKFESPEELEARMRALMNQSKVVLFMKGSPKEPQCVLIAFQHF